MSRHTPHPWPETPPPLAGPVMDDHTHLPLREQDAPLAEGYRMSLDEQLERADLVGVAQIVTVGCELPDLQATLDVARAHPHVRAALAIHPEEAALHAGFTDPSPDGLTPQRKAYHVPLVEALESVACLLADPMCVAVGETGLDYYRTGVPGREAQKESFRAHLEMGREHDLPVQVHDRDAHADAVAVLDESASRSQPVVFHAFSGDRELAQVLAAHGWYASFGGMLTFRARGELRDALAAMPRSLVLVETDAPYLTPEPHRGCPNASYSIAHTVRQIARIWGVQEGDACRRLLANSRRVYGTW